MFDALFADQQHLEDTNLINKAATIGLAMAPYSDCLNGSSAVRTRADASHAMALGLTGTPTFFIGRVKNDGAVQVLARIDGTRNLAAFSKVLDPLLEPKSPPRAGN
jgi:predicted DsbA family dithiol-disulfide isomerase